MKKTLDLLQQYPLICPKGSESAIERWSKFGYSRYCVLNGNKHGPWEAWESQYKYIDGLYNNGKKDGKWTWHNKDGSYRIVNYKEGLELNSNIFTIHGNEHL